VRLENKEVELEAGLEGGLDSELTSWLTPIAGGDEEGSSQIPRPVTTAQHNNKWQEQEGGGLEA